MMLDNNSSLGSRKRPPSRAASALSTIFPALTLVATDTVWAQYLADVIANGDAPNIRARITWNYPGAIDAAATAAEVMLYKQATERHMAYSVATTRLSTALVNSFGESNKTCLKTVFAGIALYALAPPAPSD
jgi:hypothetical protein